MDFGSRPVKILLWVFKLNKDGSWEIISFPWHLYRPINGILLVMVVHRDIFRRQDFHKLLWSLFEQSWRCGVGREVQRNGVVVWVQHTTGRVQDVFIAYTRQDKAHSQLVSIREWVFGCILINISQLTSLPTRSHWYHFERNCQLKMSDRDIDINWEYSNMSVTVWCHTQTSTDISWNKLTVSWHTWLTDNQPFKSHARPPQWQEVASIIGSNNLYMVHTYTYYSCKYMNVWCDGIHGTFE